MESVGDIDCDYGKDCVIRGHIIMAKVFYTLDEIYVLVPED